MNAPQVVSLGCRLNLAEGDRIATMLRADPAVRVINSCAVTNEALRQTRQAIRRIRKQHPDARLLVTGCAVETDRTSIAAMPEVDGIIPNAAKLDGRAWNIAPTPGQSDAGGRHTRAFVGVQTGCDHACTFCVIPRGRGKARSSPVAAVLDSVEQHLHAGAAEIVLTGVDLTSWGNDLDGQPLGTLVAAILTTFPELRRLRLSSVDSAELDPLLFDLLAGEPRVMPHLHLSLQHGHDLILKRMRRRHRTADAVALVDALKARRPEIAIGADLIAGFPTEQEAHHEANLALVDRLDIVHGHVFPFSPRAGTPASRMPPVPPPLVRERAAALRAAVAARRAQWLRAHLGQPLSVLVERDGTGYAPGYARVIAPADVQPGQVVTIVPTHVQEGTLR